MQAYKNYVGVSRAIPMHVYSIEQNHAQQFILVNVIRNISSKVIVLRVKVPF